MDLDGQILQEAGNMITNHLNDYKHSIEKAFNENDEILEVGLKARFSYVDGKFKIQTGIQFISEKIKDGNIRYYDPQQKQLFDNNATE